MLCRARPDGRLPAGHDRPRGPQGRPARDDRPLRADGRPRRDPRRAARAQRPADQGVAGRQGRLRLASTRRSTGRGSRSSTRSSGQATFVPPSGHMAGIWARNDDTRGVHKAPANEVVRGAICARAQHHQGRARPAQPERDQLHPRVPRPRHPRLGRADALERPVVALPQRPPAVQLHRGVDPRGHPVGGLRAQRPSTSGTASSGRSTRSCCGSGATARCSARRPTRRSSSSATRRTTRPRSRDAGQLIVEIGIAPVKPAEFVVFRIAQFSGAPDAE